MYNVHCTPVFLSCVLQCGVQFSLHCSKGSLVYIWVERGWSHGKTSADGRYDEKNEKEEENDDKDENYS